MSNAWKILGFVGQSAIVGLAIAFLVVLLRPDLISLSLDQTPSSSGSYAAAVAASSPSVANVYTETTGNRRGIQTTISRRGIGSAVVIDQRGYLVTNWHVISGADQIRVQLADGRVAVAEVVGEDRDTELALLRVDLPDLPTIKLGRSDSLQVGEVVLAIGNSLGLGLSQTVTMGIVSATGRGQLRVTAFEDFIQTDAAINVGNSGGALVNTNGELVGINTAVISSLAGGRTPPEGIGFAIPINLVRGVMAQLIEHGRVIRGYLGIDTSDLPAREAESFGVDGPAVLVEAVRGGPALAAGLLPGDVLTHINTQRVLSAQQAMNMVASTQPGASIRIRVSRVGGEVIDTEAVLIERPPQEGS